MGLRHIEAFRAVNVTGSMTEAARRLHTSQPQISRLVVQLEEIVGFPLYQRNGSRLVLTIEGERFAQDVEQSFSGLASLEVAASRIRAFSQSRLNVAAMPRLAGGMLARAVARFQNDFPEVIVAIHSGDAASVHSWISSGQCAMGIAMVYGQAKHVVVKPVTRVECVAIMPEGHPLAQRAMLEPADFDGEPFISFPVGSDLRNQLDDIFAAAAVTPVVVAEASLGASVCALVSAGLGLSIINPLAAAEESFSAGLVTRPFQPSIGVDIVLMFSEKEAPTRLLDVFSDYMSAMIREEIGSEVI
ncbi:LysR substrate-binding domain-containing protein [Sphingopyxis granuli]|nr:LysR substrate-binding domain-containing protein [Sphingopyxis granuli]